MKLKRILMGILSISLLANPLYAFGDEITVSGNGAGSTNNVQVTQTQTTTTTQQNTAQVTNNVNDTANTGNNDANHNNGGDVNVTTGDVNANSTINNDGINQSYVSGNCCQSGSSSINISGNGEYSNNSVGLSDNRSTNVNVNNNAQIANNVKGYANTGYNDANNNNGGNVKIKTGSIKVIDSIGNTGINSAVVKAGNSGLGDVSITIDGNAEDSNNSVTLAESNPVNVNVNNQADITNNSSWDLNTGHNSANNNNGGDVDINTGDIYLATSITNSVNTSIVDIECCNQGHNPPPDNNPPAINPGCTSSCSSVASTSNPGSTPASSPVLPVTGSDLMLLLMIGNILMFFLGGYLRLRSGRSPNYVFAR